MTYPILKRVLSAEGSGMIFSSKDFDGHEHVSFFSDPQTGLKAIIAIHNTNLGPALGGCRMWSYASEDEAATDALRLSRGMTYKAAMAKLPLGGGKSVIIGNAAKDKTPAMFERMGECVESLGGKYIVSEDVGINTDDVGYMAKKTKHAVGLAKSSGDPSPVTAYGVYTGIKAAMKHRLGHENMRDMKFSLQGLGHVGFEILRLLVEEGFVARGNNQIFVCDINENLVEQAVQKFGAVAVPTDKIYDQNVDIYIPSALGATINDNTIPRLKASIVAGCANNQLAEDRHGLALKERNVLYAPDYTINAGGLINVFYELGGNGYDRAKALDHVSKIYGTLGEVFETSAKQNIPTNKAADRIAESRFKK